MTADRAAGADDEGRLRFWIDEARRGRVGAVVEVARLLDRRGSFRGLKPAERRKVLGRWLHGCDPDVVAEGWARYVAGGMR